VHGEADDAEGSEEDYGGGLDAGEGDEDRAPQQRSGDAADAGVAEDPSARAAEMMQARRARGS